jgi:Na+-translocating ferredoxin:NAD+ oxidoreductase RnfD subunit
LGGLRRFAVAITILNVVGRAFLGFEQSWAQWLVAIGTAYSVEIVLELLLARSQQRTPSFGGGLRQMADFLLSAHIAANAVSMLLYANDELLPFMFAALVAIGSKALFRAPVGHSTRHFLNPSNFGITATLLCFPRVGIAAPYMFTENLYGWADWLLPTIIVCTGSLLNARFTQRLPLIFSWLSVFASQALIRSLLFDVAFLPGLVPMTGVAFLLFTFYMVTDPATTPSAPRNQVIFGASVAAVYSVLLSVHVVFGIFFALTIVCIARGIGLHAQALLGRRMETVIAPGTLAS